ncbi:MAG: hypothetical protein ABI439_06715 [Rhodospirillales bacterium]
MLKLVPVRIKFFKKYSLLQANKIGSQVQAEVCKYVEFIGSHARRHWDVPGPIGSLGFATEASDAICDDPQW